MSDCDRTAIACLALEVVGKIIEFAGFDLTALENARVKLAKSNDDLLAELAGAGSTPGASRGSMMAKQPLKAAADIQPVIDEMTRTVTVEGSAIVWINDEPNRIQAAIDGALANGATAAQLAPLFELKEAVKAKNDEILAALTANTPPA